MSALRSKCRHLLSARPRHFRQHAHDLLLGETDVGLDLLQWSGRLVAVEIAIEVDLIADDADLAVLGSRRSVSIQTSGTCGCTSRAKNASTLSPSGTLSVSRSSGLGSGLPSLSRQMAAVSSRSDKAERMAFLTTPVSPTPPFLAVASIESPRTLFDPWT